MRIVSVNAWCGVLHDALAEWLPECGADVLCLQEVTRTPGLGGWVDFRDDERQLATRANLFDDVRALLPNHQGFFVTCDSGPIGVGDRLLRQDFGLAVFVDQRFPVLGQLSRFVYRSYVDHGEAWALAGRPRQAQGIRIVDNGAAGSTAARRTVAVAHLHGLRDPEGKHDTPDRLDQAEALASFVDELVKPGDLAVVCGDFNVLPDSVTFDALGRLGLTDLVGTADTRTARYTKPIRHANYLLVSDPSTVVHFEAPSEPEVSDHRPLILDV
ncbi:MAG: endonuclease/exonuclease/phosphatase family protein [Actinomycetota bacterium]